MTHSRKPLTAHSKIADWIDDPAGGAMVREVLAAMGQDERVLTQVANLPLQTLVPLSRGQLSQETVDELVLRANGGVAPTPEEAGAASARFTGKTIIVTGAASGIGKATAERIIAEGGRVIAVDISPAGLDALVSSAAPEAVVAVSGDITDEQDIKRIIEGAGGDISGLANIAGIMDGMLPLHETPDDVWDRVFSVNVTGLFKLSRAVLPVMIAAGGGSIVNVASEASLRGNAAGTAYTASKHAVVGITKSTAFLYGPQGIRTNAVAPGPTATAISGEFESEHSRDRLEPFLALIPPVTTAETLASSITWLLSDDSANINGQVLASDGGWSVQ